MSSAFVRNLIVGKYLHAHRTLTRAVLVLGVITLLGIFEGPVLPLMVQSNTIFTT